MSESDLARRASELSGTVADLGESIAELMARTEGAEDRERRSRRVIGLVIVGVVLNVALSVGVVLLFRAQARTSSEVLCPLYQVMVGSFDPAAREAMPPDRRARYDEAFTVIKKGAHVLGCRFDGG